MHILRDARVISVEGELKAVHFLFYEKNIYIYSFQVKISCEKQYIRLFIVMNLFSAKMKRSHFPNFSTLCVTRKHPDVRYYVTFKVWETVFWSKALTLP